MTVAALPIEPLSRADLDATLALSLDRGWRPPRRRWALLLEQADAYGIRAPDGGLAACVTLTRYGADLAVVGMMLVAGRFGRQGLGRRLMEHVLAAAGGATVFLYATPFGRPLYQRLGFRPVGTVTTCVGVFGAPAAGATRPASDADRDALLALDATAVGADRAPLLRAHLASAEHVRVIERDGAVRGFGVAARGVDHVALGPLVAPDLDAARTLIADLAAPVAGPVRLDLDRRHDGLVGWAQERGVQPRDDVTAMVHGDRELPGDRARLILPIALASG